MKRPISGICTLAAGSCFSLLVAVSPVVNADAMPAGAAPVTQEMLDRAASDARDFLHTNGNYDQTRFYPAAQITEQRGQARARPSIFQTEIVESMETDADRGQRRDVRDHRVQSRLCARRRDGGAVLEVQAQDGPGHDLLLRPEQSRSRRLRRQAVHGHARCQARCAQCQDGRLVWEKQIADPELGYSETMAPTAVDGKILIGTNGGEYGIRGFVKAYDANSGALLWTFHTIPENSVGVWATNDATGRDMHRDIAAEKAALQEAAIPTRPSGGGVWQNTAVDRETDTVYFVVGNPSPGPVRRDAARRQPLHQLAGRGRP